MDSSTESAAGSAAVERLVMICVLCLAGGRCDGRRSGVDESVAGFVDGTAYGFVVRHGVTADVHGRDTAGHKVDGHPGDAVQRRDLFGHRGHTVTAGHPGDAVVGGHGHVATLPSPALELGSAVKCC